ncbi:hypothetical protein TNCV_3091471 [Trichonephila clavipes]|uniref:Uncharacterized protein n=1 Tax=Trichonephila clavipes TaxID=2585209 RepID=A0A8X7BGA6_TRICX|nr:hypothetical protein TNCV_3091471 [Trichonephila clavipes]
MPPNTLRVHTEYVLVKTVGPKSCGLSHERRRLENISLPFSSMKKLWRWRAQGTREYSPPLQFLAEIVDMEIGGVAIYCSFGEFHRAKSYCHLYGAQGQRQAYF